MSGQSEPDTSRAVVQTYVPRYQREEWDEHAEDLEMSRSEYVRTMVQAGRRGFGAAPDRQESTDTGENETERPELDDEAVLQERIVEVIEQEDCLSWEELVTAVAGDIETRIERALGELQDEGAVRHSGRRGGYLLEGAPDE